MQSGFCSTVVHRLQLALWNLASRIELWRFERKCRTAWRINDNTLREILQRNRATIIGRRLAFVDMLASPNIIARYRERVPPTTYDDYVSDIERIAAGEHDVLTASEVDRFGGSAGTTGSQKRIPSTARSRAIYLRFAGLVMRGVLLRWTPLHWSRRSGINLMSMATKQSVASGSLQPVSIINAGLQAIRRWSSTLWTSPTAAFEVHDPQASMYLHALFALRRDDPVYVYDVFAPHLLAWLRLIESRREDLLRDIACGSLATDLVLTCGERERLAPHLIADPSRAAVLRRHFDSGSAAIVARIWPGLTVVSVVTTGGFRACVPALRHYFGSAVCIYSPVHAATESIVGVNVDPAADTYVLACGAAFFEFIPVVGCKPGRPVELRCLESGSHYEVIVTTAAGLYRYRLDDVVEVVGFHGQAPLFRFLYRRGTIINLCGEKMTEAQTAAALRRALGGVGRYIDYAVAVPTQPGCCCYRFYIELTDKGRDATGQSVVLARAIDDALCAVNVCYRSARHRTHSIAAPEVRLLQYGGFERLRSRLQVRSGFPGSPQVKTPRLVRDLAVIAMLNAEVVCSSDFPNEFTVLAE